MERDIQRERMVSEKVLRAGNKPGMSVFKGIEKPMQYSELGEWRDEIGGIGRTSMWALVISLYFILEAMGSTQVEQILWCPVPLAYI